MVKEFEDTYQRMATDAALNSFTQEFSFPVPILPGDNSLIEDFLADIGIQLQKEYTLMPASFRLHLHYVAHILFRLVILREYLHRPPENDDDIFQLVNQSCVSWIWTPPEQALAACHGEENTSCNSHLALPPTPLLYKLAVIEDNNLILADDEPLVAIQVFESMNWTCGSALFGGLQKP